MWKSLREIETQFRKLDEKEGRHNQFYDKSKLQRSTVIGKPSERFDTGKFWNVLREEPLSMGISAVSKNIRMKTVNKSRKNIKKLKDQVKEKEKEIHLNVGGSMLLNSAREMGKDNRVLNEGFKKVEKELESMKRKEMRNRKRKEKKITGDGLSMNDKIIRMSRDAMRDISMEFNRRKEEIFHQMEEKFFPKFIAMLKGIKCSVEFIENRKEWYAPKDKEWYFFQVKINSLSTSINLHSCIFVVKFWSKGCEKVIMKDLKVSNDGFILFNDLNNLDCSDFSMFSPFKYLKWFQEFEKNEDISSLCYIKLYIEVSIEFGGKEFKILKKEIQF